MTRSTTRWLSFALLLTSVFAPSARAEPPEHALARKERPHRLWIRGIGYTGKADKDRVVMIAPRFGGAFLLNDMVDLDVEIPFVLSNVKVAATDEVETRTLIGNPFVGGSYVTEAHEHRFSVGLGATIPVAQDKRSDVYDELGYRYARAVRAGREAWLYTPDRAAAVVTGTFEHKLPHGPWLGADFGLALMPKVRGRGPALTSTTQAGVSVAAQLGDSVRLGGRLDSVLLPENEPKRLQSALVPYLLVSTPTGTLFSAELIVNLDKPYGFAFEKGGVWGLSILAGSRF